MGKFLKELVNKKCPKNQRVKISLRTDCAKKYCHKQKTKDSARNFFQIWPTSETEGAHLSAKTKGLKVRTKTKEFPTLVLQVASEAHDVAALSRPHGHVESRLRGLFLGVGQIEFVEKKVKFQRHFHPGRVGFERGNLLQDVLPHLAGHEGPAIAVDAGGGPGAGRKHPPAEHFLPFLGLFVQLRQLGVEFGEFRTAGTSSDAFLGQGKGFVQLSRVKVAQGEVVQSLEEKTWKSFKQTESNWNKEKQ